MNKKQVWKRILAGILSAGLCMGGVQVYADETEAALGRYLESDIALPEGVNPRYVASMQDGTLRLIGEAEDETGNLQMTLWDSRDEGASWDQAAALPEKFENAYFTDISLCADGSGAGITYHYDEEEDASRLSHVRFDAQGNAEEVPLPEEDWRSMQRFSANGDLVEMGIGGEVSIIDPETGEIRNTLVSEGGQNIGICGSTVVIVAQGQLQMYDLSTGDPVPVDSVLEESLYAERSDYSIVSSSSYPILFAEDEEGRLYYCTEKGIHVHTIGGSMVEQVVNGELNSLSDTSKGLVSMAVQNQCFYVILEGGGSNHMVKYAYDADAPTTPAKELRVYSLAEDSEFRQAIAAFQKENPNVYVKYETGMDGKDGVTVSDALRTLNTDILAGNGPDILILDGMPVDTYVKKGMLQDLSAILEEVKEEEGLLEQIGAAYRQEDGTIPAVPTGFCIPMAVGEPELLDQTGTLASLVGLAGQQDVLSWSDMSCMEYLLYPVYANGWKQEDGTISQEKLTEYVHGLKQIYDAWQGSASENAKEFLQMIQEEGGVISYYGVGADGLASPNALGGAAITIGSGISKVELGTLTSIADYAEAMAVNKQVKPCGMRLLKGTVEQVFLPNRTMGILNTTGETETAEQFVRYMLSVEGQMTGNSAFRTGFPVNQKAFDALMQGEDWVDYSTGVSYHSDDYSEIHLDITFPEKEEMDQFADMVEQLSVCVDTDVIQRQGLLEETGNCMRGQISEEEAVNAIMQKINLYLAEG